ncbi:MAG: flagellar biosynthesis anti-sigma factor FlgM [Dehalococcoidia bacterium]|nr:flagellar biosynthesis anti-sigma factor FlgM [Dehalococcoidia bacterium]
MSEIRKTSGSRAVVYDIAKARERKEATATAAQPADATGISEGARELSRAREAVQQAPSERAERIQQLREQIARGEYNPDPREVAKRILERGL